MIYFFFRYNFSHLLRQAIDMQIIQMHTTSMSIVAVNLCPYHQDYNKLMLMMSKHLLKVQ